MDLIAHWRCERGHHHRLDPGLLCPCRDEAEGAPCLAEVVGYVDAVTLRGAVEERDRLRTENAVLRGAYQAARGDLTDGPDLATSGGQ